MDGSAILGTQLCDQMEGMRAARRNARVHFEATLGSLCTLFRHLGILWVYEGDFGVTWVRFRKTLIFLTDFHNFMKCKINQGLLLVHFWSKNPPEFKQGAVLRRSWAGGALGRGRSEQAPYSKMLILHKSWTGVRFLEPSFEIKCRE